MKNKLIVMLLTVMMAFATFGFNTVNSIVIEFAGGTGSESNPWQIATAEQLNYVRYYLGPEHSDKYFVLNSDINLNVAPYNLGTGWTPIGDWWGEEKSNSFQGTFDGGGWTISGLFINMPTPLNWDNADYFAAGLFGDAYDATIKNFVLSNVNITGFENTGGIVGFAEKSFISGITVTGTIAGGDAEAGGGYWVGGIAGGFYDGTITGVQGGATVAGYEFVGGLVGTTDLCTISNSNAQGSITGYSKVGGLVGETQRSTIIDSYSISPVTGSKEVGGLVGCNNNHSSIIKSFSEANVMEGYQSIGGLVGRNNDYSTVIYCNTDGSTAGATDSSMYVAGLVGENSYYSTISQSFSTVHVVGDDQLGGLVGNNSTNSTVINSYASGGVESTNDNPNSIVAGLVAVNTDGSLVSKSYAVGVVSGSGYRHGGLVGTNFGGQAIDSSYSLGPAGDGGTIVSEAAMRMESTFIDWDFVNVWGISEDVSYPSLIEAPTNFEVESVITPASLNVEMGTALADLSLPTMVQVVLADSSTSYAYLPVTWDGGTPAYDGNTNDIYVFEGMIATVAGITNTGGNTASINVMVGVPPDKEISSIGSLADINVLYGTLLSSIDLPTTVQAVLDDTSTTDMAVTWDNSTPGYDGNTSGTYVFKGTLTMIPGIANTGAYTASVNVIVEIAIGPPVITSQPTDCSVQLGEMATFSVEYSSNPEPGIVWQISTNNGKKWNNIPNVTSASYSFFVTSATMDGYMYRAILSNNMGSPVTTKIATLTVTYGTADVGISQSGIYDSSTNVITWTITAINNGPDKANGVSVRCTLINGTKVQNAITDFGYQLKGRTIIFNIGDLNVGEETVMTIEALVTRAVSPFGNTVTVTTTSLDEVTTNNTSSITVN